MIDNIHQMIMQEALQLAWEAFYREEVPVGALIVLDEQIIVRAFNKKEMTHDPTAHAEMIALREACARVNSWHLDDAIMYVTLEPCPMCAYAIIQARLKKLIFGAYDTKAGAAGSVINIFEKKLFNHEVEVIGGILEEECGAVLKKFFLNRR
jgi:tRNA(adenine34) deaminase